MIFVAELKRLSQHCDFGDNLNDTLRDKLVCGLTSESIQKCLLSESELSFRRAVELAIGLETAAKDSVELRNKGGPEVHKMNTKPGAMPSRSSGAQSDGNYRGSCF